MTPIEVVEFAEENDCRMVDYKFLDFVGIWQHFSTPITEFGEDTFDEGIGFDGSSIRGWQPIHNSDMLLIPDPTTAKIDPFIEVTTLSLICDIMDPITREGYTRDPRFIAKKLNHTLNRPGLPIPLTLGPSRSFSSSTMSVIPPVQMSLFIQSTQLKASGIPVVKNSLILVTSHATKKVIFPVRQQIHMSICVMKWFRFYKVWV